VEKKRVKSTKYDTMKVSGRLHPHGHRQKMEGPWSFQIGRRSQPVFIQSWETQDVLISMHQPSETENLTILYVLYLRNGVRKPSFASGVTFHRAREYRRPGGDIEVRVKKRYGNLFQHPLPIGRYQGTCIYSNDSRTFGFYTFQASTLKVEPKPATPKVIITPGDEGFHESLRNAKRTLSRDDGLE